MERVSWAHLIALPAGAPGRGRAYGGAAVPMCADARPPGVPRSGGAEPGSRAHAAGCHPASGSFPRFGKSLLGKQMGVSLRGWVGAKGGLKT